MSRVATRIRLLAAVLTCVLSSTVYGGNYPGGIKTLDPAGCVKWVPDKDLATPGIQGPAKFQSTGVDCGTANSVLTKAYASLGTPANGTTYYCPDCASTTPCTGGGTGNFAFRTAGVWACAVSSASTECASAACNLNTATTLNSVAICLANGTNCPAASGVVAGIVADSGGTTTGATVTLAGGDGITTTRSTDTVTIDVDTTVVQNDQANTLSQLTKLYSTAFQTSLNVDGVTWDPATKILQADDGTVRANDVVCGAACIDISGETNLAATGGITLTGDTLSLSVTATPTPTLTATPTPTTSPTPTLSATPTPYPTFNPAQWTDFTWSDGTAATATQSFDLTGADDPAWQAETGGFQLRAKNPALTLNDTDQADGAYPDAQLSVSCEPGPTCGVAVRHSVGGALRTVLWGGATGGAVLGDAATEIVTVLTDGTGDAEVVLPFNSVQLAGGAGASEVTGTLPVDNGGTGRTTAMSFTKTFTIPDNGAAISASLALLTLLPNLGDPYTITQVCCKLDAGTATINLQRDDGTAANILAGDLTCATVLASGCTTAFSGSETSIATGHNVDFYVKSNPSSLTKQITVAIKHTIP